MTITEISLESKRPVAKAAQRETSSRLYLAIRIYPIPTVLPFHYSAGIHHLFDDSYRARAVRLSGTAARMTDCVAKKAVCEGLTSPSI